MHLEPGKELYTIDEAAALFEVERQTIYDWMSRRGLRWVWVGGRRRFTREALQSFVRPGGDDTPAAPDQKQVKLVRQGVTQ